jgi:hypothetical protein
MKITKREEEILGALNPEQREFVELLLPKLPPVVAREQVKTVLGGIIAPNTLKNADCAGKGPYVAWEVGRKKAYETVSLLAFIATRYEVKRLATIKSL